MSRWYRGVTLIEILVVVAIIAVLAAIIYPIAISAREKGNEAKCLTQQKSLYQATMVYVQNHDEKFPTNNFWQALELEPKALKDPSDPTLANGYVFNSYLQGRTYAAVKDSLNVMMFADGTHDITATTQQNLAYGPDDIQFRHGNKTVMTFADGHQIITKDQRDLPIEFKNAPAVEFMEADEVTGGTFYSVTANKYLYGTQGYVLCAWNNAPSGAVTALNTSYVASVIPTGATNQTWVAAPADDPRAVINPATKTYAASAWLGDASYAIALKSATDNAIHTVRIFCLDYDNQNRIQDISAVSTASKSLMKKGGRAALFNEGVWLTFRFRGNVTFKSTKVQGPNSVVSAFAFD